MKTKVVALVMLIGAGVTGGKLTRDRESVRLQPGPVVTETAQGWAVDCTGKPDCGVQCDGAGCDVQDGKTEFGVEWPEDDWSTNKGANCSIACDKGSCSVVRTGVAGK
jgi:hypothetical protein